jgi:hypothetical protein
MNQGTTLSQIALSTMPKLLIPRHPAASATAILDSNCHTILNTLNSYSKSASTPIFQICEILLALSVQSWYGFVLNLNAHPCSNRLQ